MTRPDPAVICDQVERTYGIDGSVVPALRGVSLTLPPGTITALVGPSGSGKSTLLRLLACMDRPDSGQITIAGTEVSGLSRTGRVRLRRTRLGFLYQTPADNLLAYLTVREHLELGASLRGLRKRQVRRLRSRPAVRSGGGGGWARGRPGQGERDPQVAALLDRLGLADRADHRPRQLSGGEQQRTAIAFAAIGPPALLVADEPTGQLDHATAEEVLAALRVLATTGVAVVAATHDPAVSRQADQVVYLRDGQVVEEGTWH